MKESNCNIEYNIMLSFIHEGYEKYFPWVKVSRKRSKDRKWITQGLKLSSNTKNKLYRQYREKSTTQRNEK